MIYFDIIYHMQAETSFQQLVKEICQENEIGLTWMSSNWMAQLDKGDKRRYILGHKFDLNSAASALVADDKYATFEVLKKDGVPVIEHSIIYEKDNHEPYVLGRNSLDYITEYFDAHQKHIVIKPNLGQCGNNVYQITDTKQITPILEKVFHQSMSASLCPFYQIQHEYRVILLDGEERLSYQKNLGDGWKFNLCHGATAQPIQNELMHQCIVNIAQKAAKALDLRFCSVDIIDTVEHELLVMEVNSGVMTENYLKQYPEQRDDVKIIYGDAIQKMFEA